MSATVADRRIENVPQPIVDALRGLISRVRLVMLVRGLLAVAAIAIACLLIGMAIDAAFTIFSTGGRVALSLTLLAVVLAGAWWYLIRPLARTFTLSGMARIIEERHPELEERLSSAVELLTSGDAAELRGSEALIAELAKEASVQAVSVQPKDEFTFAIARRYLVAALVAAAILLLVVVLWPGQSLQLANRVIAPFANIGNVQATSLVVQPGDVVLAEGDPLRIEVMVPDRRVKAARVYTTAPEAQESVHRMSDLSADEHGNPRFALSLPSVTESFRYRIHTGGALTQYYNVTVVPRPAIERIDLHYDYPTYMYRELGMVEDSDGEIEGPIGTKVTIIATANTELSVAQLLLDGASHSDGTVETKDGVSTCRWQITLTEDMVGGRKWGTRLEDQHGFVNWPTERLIRAIRDRAPRIRILAPDEDELRLKPTDTLPIQFAADDDHGIAKTEMLLALGTSDQPPQLIPPPADTNKRRFVTDFLLDLGTLPLTGVNHLTVQFRATDNLPVPLGGPQTAHSRTLNIVLDKSVDTYFEREAAKDYASLREALLEVLRELEEAKQRSDKLDEVANIDGPLPPEVAARIDQLRQRTGNAETGLRELADTLPTTAFAALEPKVIDLADTDVHQARESAAQVKLTEAADERAAHSAASDQHVDRSLERTKELLAELDQLWEKIQEIAELQDLAAQQREIAEQTAAIEPEDAAQQAQTALEQQAEVAEQIAELVSQSPEAASELLESQLERVEQLAEKTQQLAEAQQELAELTEQADTSAEQEAIRERIAEQILEEQREIISEATALENQIAQAEAAENLDLTQKPEAVAEQIESGDIGEAADEAQAAAEDFAAAAEELGQQAGEEQAGQQQAGEQQAGEQQAGEQQAGEQQGGEQQAGEQQAGEQQGGEQQGGEQQGGEQQGGEQQGGEQQGGEQQGGEQQGGEQQGGEQQGGEQQGGEQQGGEQQGGEQQGGEQQGGEQQGGEQQGGEQQGGEQQGGEQQGGEQQGGEQQGGEQQGGEQQAGQPQASELAQAAAELAERQQNVAEQLEALESGDIGEALAALQAAVAGESVEAAEEAAALEALAEALNQSGEAQAAAGEAAEQLAAASEAAGEAQAQLSEAQQGEGQQGEGQQGEGQQGEGQQGEGQQGEGQQGEGQQGEGQQGEGQQGEGQQGEGQQGEGQQGQGQQGQGQQGQPSTAEAQQSQAQAVAALEQAAEALTELGQQLAQAAEAAPAIADSGTGESPAGVGELVEALEEATTAAAGLEALGQSGEAPLGSTPSTAPFAPGAGESPASAPAQAAASAAESLASAAQAAAQQAGVPTSTPSAAAAAAAAAAAPGSPSPSQSAAAGQSSAPGQAQAPGMQAAPGTGEQGRIGGTTDNQLSQTLEKYNLTRADWTRLPGQLRDQILQAEAEGAPEEYRDMVRRYFRELAKRSTRKNRKE